MKKTISFFLLLTPFLSNGQKFKRHEIGIAIGYIQYNVPIYKNISHYNSVTSTIPFLTSKYYHNDGYSKDINSNFKTTPTIYYSFSATKKLSFRINFQFFKVSSNSPLKQHIDGAYYYYYNIERKTLNTNFGFEHSLYHKKYKQLYWGLEINYEKGKQHETGKGHSWFGSKPDFYLDKKSKFMMGGINGFIGTKLKITNTINTKIEASLFITEGIGIRPINRLSLNYQF